MIPKIQINFNTSELISEYPPKISHRNKKVILDIAYPDGFIEEGKVVYTHWDEMDFPKNVNKFLKLEVRGDIYDYKKTCIEQEKVMEWHVNFADSEVFFAYGSGLFAQDEIQVAEHPVLGSIRECLKDLDSSGTLCKTVINGKSSPILISGVKRRVSILIDELYGSMFDSATEEIIRRYAIPISPSITNIIAIAAPYGGIGLYNRYDIDSILKTAYTGFHAAKLETSNILGKSSKTVVHTGFWGCGAFGGNKILMTLLQVIAARLSEIDCLVFHAVNKDGLKILKDVDDILKKILIKDNTEMETLLCSILDMSFKWGISDGN